MKFIKLLIAFTLFLLSNLIKIKHRRGWDNNSVDTEFVNPNHGVYIIYKIAM
jgi:hypothetical protein